MAIQYNRYYTVKAAGPEAIKLTTTLLQAFPITRACLGILGKKLLDQVGFGFFNEDEAIITQAEQGKDLFLLCDEAVDVFVDKQKVVQMDAPTLLGDKGIVEPESRRAATIQAAPDNTCFLLKIPMGLFIRNFDDMSIEDATFEQEIGIFYNMFKGIQARLFEYAFMQKNLWEEAITTQTLAKTQKLIKILDNRIDDGWDNSVWDVVRAHLNESLGFSWPGGVPLDISTFRNLLRQHLDGKYPRETFKGKDADYIRKKHQIWRKWLATTAASIIKSNVLQEDEIAGSHIQLFNPRNYQLRIQGLIRAIEKRFLSSKIRDLTDGKDVSKENGTDAIKNYFGRTEQDNTFDLKRYLNTFERTFKLKYPKRMQTQIAQRTALVAAKCENEFNESVAAMISLLENSQAQISDSYKIQMYSNKVNPQSDNELITLSQGVTKYYQFLDEPTLGKIGKVTYKHESTPSIAQLIKTANLKQDKKAIHRIIQNQVKRLDISARLLPFEFIKNNFHLCEGKPDAEILNHDLERHYWMPLSKGFRLYAGDQDFGEISPGSLIGGKGWVQEANDEGGKSLGVWKLKMHAAAPEDENDQQNYLALVLPSQSLPWEINSTPNASIFKTTHLPLLQWLINKQITHISLLIPARDEKFENLQKTEQVVRLESKVKAFENTSAQIPLEERRKIVDFLNNVVGLRLPYDKPFASNKLSKKIYNHILKQMALEYSALNAELLGNKTYTKWRMILSELVQITEQAELEKSVLSSTPFFEIIENELLSILSSFSIPKPRKFIRLTGQTPYIQLPLILNSLENPDQDRHLMFDLIQSTLETYLRLLIEESRLFGQKYETEKEKRPQTDVESLQINTILESSEKLKAIIMRKQEGIVPPSSKSA